MLKIEKFASFALFALMGGVVCAAPKESNPPPKPYTFMGVELGKELSSLTFCGGTNADWSDTGSNVPRPCYTGRLIPEKMDQVQYIRFSVADKLHPKGVTRARLEVISGVVEGMIVETDGVTHQDELLELLVKMFGEPMKASNDAVQNRMGATFTNRQANWDWEGLHVMFAGLSNSIDKGFIAVQTDKGLSALTKSQKAEASF